MRSGTKLLILFLAFVYGTLFFFITIRQETIYPEFLPGQDMSPKHLAETGLDIVGKGAFEAIVFLLSVYWPFLFVLSSFGIRTPFKGGAVIVFVFLMLGSLVLAVCGMTVLYGNWLWSGNGNVPGTGFLMVITPLLILPASIMVLAGAKFMKRLFAGTHY